MESRRLQRRSGSRTVRLPIISSHRLDCFSAADSHGFVWMPPRWLEDSQVPLELSSVGPSIVLPVFCPAQSFRLSLPEASRDFFRPNFRPRSGSAVLIRVGFLVEFASCRLERSMEFSRCCAMAVTFKQRQKCGNLTTETLPSAGASWETCKGATWRTPRWFSVGVPPISVRDRLG